MRQIVLLTLTCVLSLPTSAMAGKQYGYSWLGCSGGWATWRWEYTYTDGDRRNYYWIKRNVCGDSWQNMNTPAYETDSQGLNVGVSHNYSFMTQACLNSDETGSCNPTDVMLIPQAACPPP